MMENILMKILSLYALNVMLVSIKNVMELSMYLMKIGYVNYVLLLDQKDSI